MRVSCCSRRLQLRTGALYTKPGRRAVALALAFACLACGVQPVELLPVEPGAVGADEFVMGELPAQALARLRSQRSEQGEALLQLIQPVPPELVVPADLASIVFEWQITSKGKPDAADSPPGAAGHAAPPVAEPVGGPKSDKGMMRGKADREPPIAYELRAHSELSDVRLYCSASAAAFPADRWRELLRGHSGATLRIELRGVDRYGVILHAPALELRVRAALPAGLFYSFSTNGQGITVGQISDTHERGVPMPAPLAAADQRCVGCHALSRDGLRMLAIDAAQGRLLRWALFDADADALSLEWPQAAPGLGYIQASFDGTAARIAAAAAGQLLIFNADTGALLQQTGMPLMAAVSGPDWSPDGRAIVVETGADAGASSLARLEVGLDGSLSALTPLIEATGDETLHAPVYSPDGEWIAYERRMGPAAEDKATRLFLVRARGGEPIELRALAHPMRPKEGASSPTFARAGDPDHVYLLFSSPRALGTFVPEEGQRQLYAAELDLSLAAAGKDPSHAAFWLPFQQRSNSYLRTLWAPARSACTSSLELCDKLDDDCDGTVDEECCTPAAEGCGDGRDNDCDARVDEGCGCAFQETCGNQADDDCDLRVDEKPCSPAMML